jgi:CubicO group peptidase (beta-lactamase class C family)
VLKPKVFIIRTVFLLCLGLPLTAFPKDFTGDWYGAVETDNQQNRYALHIEKDAKGNLALFYDDLIGGETHQPLTGTITRKRRKLVVEDPALHITVELKLDAKGDSITGTETIQGKTYPLQLQRGLNYTLPRVDKEGNAVTQYNYQAPATLSDGWPVGDIRNQKVDLDLLVKGVGNILQGKIPGLHSLLVIQHGTLLLEEYFRGYGPQDPNPQYSATKSVFSIVYGIAQDQGLIDIHQKVADLYPETRKDPKWDPAKNAITVGDLLSMTSGLDCDDIAVGSATPCYSGMAQSQDWISFCLSLPLLHSPGTHWTYNGTSLTLLANYLVQKSGMGLQDFSQKFLFQPLGIASSQWILGPHGAPLVNSGLWLKPRDMAKLGLMYLNKGKWEGKQVVSEKWVKDSTTVHCPRSQAFGHEYGYLWHVQTMDLKGRDTQVFYANGYGGQEIYVVPDVDLVCVMTAGTDDYTIYGRESTLLEETILSAFYPGPVVARPTVDIPPPP